MTNIIRHIFTQDMGNLKFLLRLRLELVSGQFPKRALRAVLDWYDLHKDELIKDWQLATNDQPLNKIEPLE